jgi:hypothetical protein
MLPAYLKMLVEILDLNDYEMPIFFQLDVEAATGTTLTTDFFKLEQRIY